MLSLRSGHKEPVNLDLGNLDLSNLDLSNLDLGKCDEGRSGLREGLVLEGEIVQAGHQSNAGQQD